MEFSTDYSCSQNRRRGCVASRIYLSDVKKMEETSPLCFTIQDNYKSKIHCELRIFFNTSIMMYQFFFFFSDNKIMTH